MAAAKAEPESSQGSQGWHNFPAGLRVMVVDDDQLCLKVIAKMLKQCSYSVVTCSSSSEALAILREKTDEYDLVLSDVVMPDIDGFKLLEIIGLEMDIPVIMMSSNGDTETVLQGVTHGAVDFLIKPVRTEELRNIWQHVLRKRKELVRSGGEPYPNQAGKSEDRNECGSQDLADMDQTSPETRKRVKDGRWEAEDAGQQSLKRPRVHWSADMHQQFVCAVNTLGIDKAVPKKILELMNVDGLTRENVASHLQKYRLYLKKTSQLNGDDSGAGFLKMSTGGMAHEVARPTHMSWDHAPTTSHLPAGQAHKAAGYHAGVPYMPTMPTFLGAAQPGILVPQVPAAPVRGPADGGMAPFLNFVPVPSAVPQVMSQHPPNAAQQAHQSWQQQPIPPSQPQMWPMQPTGVAYMAGGMHAAGGQEQQTAVNGSLQNVFDPSPLLGPSPALDAVNPNPADGGAAAAMDPLMTAPLPAGHYGGAHAHGGHGGGFGTKRESIDIAFSPGFLDDLTDNSLLVGSEISMQADPALDDFLNFLAKDEPDL